MVDLVLNIIMAVQRFLVFLVKLVTRLWYMVYGIDKETTDKIIDELDEDLKDSLDL